MIDCTKITEIANAKLVGTDLFVVDCTCSPANEVELLIDSDTSVGIETCVELSRAIEAEFDRDTEDFSLTVASAGIGSELKHLRQYRKLIRQAGRSAAQKRREDSGDARRGRTQGGTHPLLRGEAGRRG